MLYRIVIFIIIIFAFSFKNVLANCDFKHFNYIEELKDISSLDSIIIEVNKKRKFYKNFARIIVSKSKNIPPKLKKNFNANVTVNYKFGKCTYKARIRQLGDWKDHVKVINGQPLRSLKVNLKEGNIFNAIKFKLLIPETREHYNEILGTIILRKFGFLVPETFETNLILNGSTSKIIFQEDTVKEFLERNHKREGPIFEGDESLLWSYNDRENFELENLSLSRLTNYKWFLRGKNSEYIVLKAFNELQKSYLEYTYNFPKSKLLILPNNEKDKIFKDYYFILTAMNGWHALRPHNRKFYYNSFNDNFEPIYYDGMFNLDSPLWINLINDDLKIFNKNYTFSDLKLLSEKDFKEKILIDFKKRVIKFDEKLNLFFINSIENIVVNSKKIQNLINKSHTDKINVKNNKNYLENYLFRINEKNINQKNIIALFKDKHEYHANLQNNKKIILTSQEVSEILRKNLHSENRYVILNTFNSKNKDLAISKELNLDNSINGSVIYSKGISFEIDKIKRIINVKQSNNKDWIFFKNLNFKNWNIKFYGLIGDPSIDDLSQRFNNNGLTGCLNFLNTTFNNTSIKMINGSCEDSINIINSKGTLNSIDISKALSDALDLDFSNISIENLFISNSGNDCLDVSGGSYKIISANLSGCKDKALSIGEISEFNASKINIIDSNIGISVKDFSKSFIKDYYTKNVSICAEAFQKKQEFGGAIANFKNLKCNGLYNHDLNSLINKNYNEF